MTGYIGCVGGFSVPSLLDIAKLHQGARAMALKCRQPRQIEGGSTRALKIKRPERPSPDDPYTNGCFTHSCSHLKRINRKTSPFLDHNHVLNSTADSGKNSSPLSNFFEQSGRCPGPRPPMPSTHNFYGKPPELAERRDAGWGYADERQQTNLPKAKTRRWKRLSFLPGRYSPDVHLFMIAELAQARKRN